MKLLTTKKLGTMACLAIGLGAGAQLHAQTTVTLTPTADTYIQNGTPDTNYGTATTLLARIADAEGLSRADYLQFELSGLPAGTVSSARLRLYGAHDPGGTGVTVGVFPMVTSPARWSETAVTWNNGQVSTGVDFASTIATRAVTTTAQYYEWDITSYIASRRAAGYATVGVYPTAANTYRVTFNSKEAAANRPQLVVTVGGTPPAPTNWPMFGRDYSNTRAVPDTTISAANVSRLGVIRRIADGGVTGTPSIVDGVAYYSDFYGYAKAVRVSDGVTLWRVRPQTTMLSPSPFVTADTVYVAGNYGWVYALWRSSGATRWARQIETTPNQRVSSSPIVVGNIVIIGSGSYQVFVPGSPMFRGGIVFLDASSGAILRRTNVCPVGSCGGGVSVWSTAAVDTATRTGYIGTGQAYADPAGPYSDALVAFNIDTAAIRWVAQFVANDVYQLNGILRYDYDVGAAPNLFVANGRNMVGVGGKDGTYRAYDRATGAQIWRTPVGRASAIGGVMQATAYGNGRIYVVSNTSTQGTGRNDPVPATATAYALNAATGAPVWSLAVTGGGFGGIAYANELMYASVWDGRLRVFNAATGGIVREVQASPARGAYVPAPTDGFPNGSASGPSIYGGRIYMGYGWTWVLTISGGIAQMGLL